MNIYQFIVTLMKFGEVIEHRVNCNDEFSAKNIALGIFGDGYRVVDIQKV